MWTQVNAINGESKSGSVPTIVSDGANHATNTDKANTLADKFSFVSSSRNYNPDFIVRKTETEKLNPLDNIQFDDMPINDNFWLFELK